MIKDAKENLVFRKLTVQTEPYNAQWNKLSSSSDKYS